MDSPSADPWSRRRFLAATVAGCAAGLTPRLAPARAKDDPVSGTPAAALQQLLDGNRRFVQGDVLAPHRDRVRRAAVAAKQTPFAAILGCADSRVPPEIVFDQGVGDLFVVRVAGNLVTPEGLASLEYGTLVLGARALVVLGHTRCGAVEAALAGAPVPGQISALFQYIAPGLERSKTDLTAAIEENVHRQAKTVVAGSPVIADLVRHDRLVVKGAIYDLETGAVRMLG